MTCGLVAIVLLLQIALGGYPVAFEINARAAPPSPVLNIGFLQTIDSLNPYIGLNDASYLLYGLIYDYPYAFDQDGNYIPNIITDATHDNALMNWTYTVRQGVKWSDGTDLTAADVAFTWNYDSQNLFFLWAYEPYFNQVVQCTGTNKGHCGAVISPSDPWKVTVYFKRPFISGPDLFGPIVQEAQWMSIKPSDAESTYPNPNPIGTGPFIADPNIYSEWQQNGAVPLHLYRNTKYHTVGNHVGQVNITDIYLWVYNDPTILALHLLNGDINMAQMTTAGILAVEGKPNILTQKSLQAIQEWNEIGISQIDKPKVNGGLNNARFDVNVRVAMARATNKDYILQTIYRSQGVRGDTLVSPITRQWWYDPVAGGDNLTFDISLANTILDNAGYTNHYTGADGGQYRAAASNIVVSYQTSCYQCVSPPNVTKTITAGTHLNFTLAVRPADQFPEEKLVADYIKAQWKQIGIEITEKPEPSEDALSKDVYGGKVETYIWYWSADPDPNYILSMQSSWTLDGWNDNYWNNATYNYYYLKQLSDQNNATREADVKAAQKIEYDSAVYIINLFPFGQWAMRTDLWQGWGDWTAHPYRQMNAYWGANPLWFDLNCPSCAAPPTNQPPTNPVITGSRYLSTYTGVNLTLSATSSDAETSDQLNWTWTWGDGNSTVTHGTAASPTSTYGHVWTLPGNYTVRVSVSDGHSAPVATNNPAYVNVSTPPANLGTLQGTVKDTSGGAISGAQVITTPGNRADTTGSTGAYSISLPSATYSVTATAPLFNSQTLSNVVVSSGASTWRNFTLTPNVGWIVGTVTDQRTGTGIGGAAILATSSTGAQKAGSANSQGQFNLSVEPGTFTVNASATGYVAATRTGVVVISGREKSVAIALTPLSTGAQGLDPIVLAAIAIVVVIVAVALLAVLLMRRRTKKEAEEARINLPPKP